MTGAQVLPPNVISWSRPWRETVTDECVDLTDFRPIVVTMQPSTKVTTRKRMFQAPSKDSKKCFCWPRLAESIHSSVWRLSVYPSVRPSVHLSVQSDTLATRRTLTIPLAVQILKLNR